MNIEMEKFTKQMLVNLGLPCTRPTEEEVNTEFLFWEIALQNVVDIYELISVFYEIKKQFGVQRKPVINDVIEAVQIVKLESRKQRVHKQIQQLQKESGVSDEKARENVQKLAALMQNLK